MAVTITELTEDNVNDLEAVAIQTTDEGFEITVWKLPYGDTPFMYEIIDQDGKVVGFNYGFTSRGGAKRFATWNVTYIRNLASWQSNRSAWGFNGVTMPPPLPPLDIENVKVYKVDSEYSEDTDKVTTTTTQISGPGVEDAEPMVNPDALPSASKSPSNGNGNGNGKGPKSPSQGRGPKLAQRKPKMVLDDMDNSDDPDEDDMDDDNEGPESLKELLQI